MASPKLEMCFCRKAYVVMERGDKVKIANFIPVLTWGSSSLLVILLPGICLAQDAKDDIMRGKELSEMWCSSCHAVSQNQQQVVTAAPTFQSIARSRAEEDTRIDLFLVDPHPPMPDLSLSRQEIENIQAYIWSIR